MMPASNTFEGKKPLEMGCYVATRWVIKPD